MAWVITHPRQPLYQGRHPRQGPQVRDKPVGPRPLAKRYIHPSQLLAVQFGLTPCSTCTPKRLGAAAPPLLVPTAHTLPAHLQCTSHRCQNLTGAKQLPSLLSPTLQSGKIPSRTKRSLHALIMHEAANFVTLFCEIP